MTKWFGIAVLIGMVALGAAFACAGGGDDDDTADDDSGGDDSGDDDTGGPPTYPNNHDAGWDCYTCHESDFNGAPGEPHGHSYTAPDDCVGCHDEGDWTNDSDAPDAMNQGQDCRTCHVDQHGKTWEAPEECLVCHQ
jgi:hypothetical protein